MFSSAGLIDTNRRNRLKPETFEAIERVKLYYKAERRRLEGIQDAVQAVRVKELEEKLEELCVALEAENSSDNE